MARTRTRRDTTQLEQAARRAAAPGGGLHARVLELQRTVGNQATTALLQRRAEAPAPKAPPGVEVPREETAPTVDLRFADVDVLNPEVRRGQTVLAKFTVVNEGTGKTSEADVVTVSPRYDGTVWTRHNQEVDFGARPIEPNGGTKTFVAKFRNLRLHGNWDMVFAIFHSPKWISQRSVPFHIGPP